jgi:hypothetical protein
MLAKSPQKMPQRQEIGTEHFHIESHSFLLGNVDLASHWRLMLKNITGLPSSQLVIFSWMVTYRIMRIVSFPQTQRSKAALQVNNHPAAVVVVIQFYRLKSL